MQTKLMPIFKLRSELFKIWYPKFYEIYNYNIKQSSLAAQDYYLSGNYHTDLETPFYIYVLSKIENYHTIHNKYNICFNDANHKNYLFGPTVADLCKAFDKDIKAKIINKSGKIINETKLKTSRILQSPYVILEKIDEKQLDIDKIIPQNIQKYCIQR